MLGTYLGLYFAFILVCLDLTGTAVLLPAMRHSLSLSFSEIQWIINIYLVMMASVVLVSGKIANRVGFKNLLIFGLIIFGVGSVFCASAPGFVLEIVGRALQGIGAAVIFPISIAIIKHIAPPEKASTYLGFFIAFNSILFALGGFIAGFFAQYLTWRYFFFVNIPIVILACLIIGFSMKKIVHRESFPIDLFGLLLLIVCILSLVFALMDAPLLGWSSWWIMGALIVSVVCLVSFILFELHLAHPLIRFSLFSNVRLTFIMIILASMQATFMTITFFTIFVQMNWHFSAVSAGFLGVITGFSMTFFATIHGKVAARISESRTFFLGQLFLFIGLCFMSAAIYLGFVWLAIGLFLLGLGIPTIAASAFTLGLEMVPKREHAIVSSMIYAARYIGGAVAFALQGSIVNTDRAHFNQYHRINSHYFFIAMIVITVFGGIAALMSTLFLKPARAAVSG
jgi:EmrB/QacA subfamily drug resistance transporter